LFWLSLVAIVVATPLLLLALFYWASKDHGVDREIARERFQAKQELRWLRRSSGNVARPLAATSDPEPDGEHFAEPKLKT
jgi:hypothetical protein